MTSLVQQRPLYLRLLTSIPFWISLYFLVRLIGITQAPAEVSHNWRQTTVCMVARNFLEVDANILYPRVDMAGNKSGITGMEFPLLNYCIYLLSTVFGYAHWYGRFINLVVTSIGILFFGKIVKQLTSDKAALFAVILLLNSSWLIFGRKIMPDTFSISLVLIGGYYAIRFFETKRYLFLIPYSVLLAIGCLVKLPAIVALGMLAPVVFSNPLLSKQNLVVAGCTCLALIPVVWWYFLWVPHLVETFGFWHFFMGISFTDGVSQLASHLDEVFKHFYFSAMKWVGFGLYLAGIVHIIIKKNRPLIMIFATSSLLLFVLMGKAGYVFYIHDYYILPFVPIMALLGGQVLSTIKSSKIQVLVLVLFIADSVGNQFHDWRIKESYRYKLTLEETAERISQRDDLIAINSGGNPSDMYFAHRKGWVVPTDFFNNEQHVDSLKKLGCKHFFITRELDKNHTGLNDLELSHESEQVRVYSFKTSSD